MLFVRYENFRQYVRLYPANTVFLAVMLVLFLWQQIDPGLPDLQIADLQPFQ